MAEKLIVKIRGISEEFLFIDPDDTTWGNDVYTITIDEEDNNWMAFPYVNIEYIKNEKINDPHPVHKSNVEQL